MLRLQDIQDSLLGIIGWKQDSTSDIVLSEELTKSETGLYFQQAHPLLTLSNLFCIAPDFNGSDNRSELFSEWLKDKTKASIVKLVNRFCTEKLNDGTLKILCENKTLFENTGRLSDTVNNRDNFVGFEIIPVRAKGVTIKINKIGLQFTKAGLYTLYLMHSSSYEPVRVIEVEKKVRGFEWVEIPDLYLPYQGEGTDAGGSWFLCYKQSELPEGSQAIKKDKDWSKEPCKSCSRKEFMSWQAWSKYLEIHPFYIKEEYSEDLDGSVQLWDIANNVYTYDNNYGLNLDVTIYCDVTDFIIKHRTLFQDALMKQVAIDLLMEFAYNANVRTNRHSINASRVDILYEIDGDSSSMKKSGLSYQLDMAIKALDIDLRGIDRICLPCKNNGIKYRTI